MNKTNVVVLISGRGSNLRAIVEANHPNVSVVAVISNRSKAAGLLYAQEKGIATEFINHKKFENREVFDQALIDKIDSYQPQLVVLAGFMRILTPMFIRHYQGRLLNIHPSLLPKYRGLHTHQRALEAGDKAHGASVHFVTEDLDAGPIILQARVPILPDDDEETLAARVLTQEHRIYPQAIQWFAQDRLQLNGNVVFLDGKPVIEMSYQN